MNVKRVLDVIAGASLGMLFALVCFGARACEPQPMALCLDGKIVAIEADGARTNTGRACVQAEAQP